jgi:hypothetical protein
MKYECGIYWIKCTCGAQFYRPVYKGKYEFDSYCPNCSEHLGTAVVDGDSFEAILYVEEVEFEKRCLLWEIWKLTWSMRSKPKILGNSDSLVGGTKKYICGFYWRECCCGKEIYKLVHTGHYEYDVYCPNCAEHLRTVIVQGDYFETIEYSKGLSFKKCSLSDIMKLMWTSRPSFKRSLGTKHVGKTISLLLVLPFVESLIRVLL